MAEQNPIKYSDLISPDDSIENLIHLLERLSGVYDGLVTNIKQKAADLSAAMRTVSGATDQGKKSVQDASQESVRLTQVYRETTNAQKQLAIGLAQLQEEKRRETQQTKYEAQMAMYAAGSYNYLSAQYNYNKNILNKLTAEERANNAEAKQLEKNTKEIYEEMKRLQEATGKMSLNVGNYTESITNAIGANSKWFKTMQQLGNLFEGGFSSGVKQAGSAVAAFGKQLLALLANPIVATIAAITAAFLALAKGISSSEENTMRFKIVLAPFERVLTGIVNVLQLADQGVLRMVDGFEKLAMGASKLLERLPYVGNAIRGVNKEIEKNIELVRRRQQLELDQRVTNEQIEKWRMDIERMKTKAVETKDDKLRLMLLGNANALEHEIMKERVRLAKEAYDLAEKESEQAQNSKEANEKKSEALKDLYRVQAEYYQSIRRNSKQISNIELGGTEGGGGGASGKSEAMSAEEAAKELERIEKQKAANLLKAKRGYEDANAQLIEDEYDRERVLTILNYQRQEEDLKQQLQQLGDDEVEAKKYINDQIIALEQQKWNKLADIADKQQKAVLDAEERDLQERLRATDKMIAEKNKREAEQKKKEEEQREERKRAVQEALQYSLDHLQTFLDAWAEAAENKRNIADNDVEHARSVLEAEVEARKNGYANDVEGARKELEEKKKIQQKAIKEQERAKRAQMAIDTAMQVSSLITATAEIWKAYAGIPFAGTGLAIAATALMWGSFLASKIMAFSAVSGGTEEYGDGTVELLQGGSHQSGNDIDLGRKKDGTRRRAEGGEYFAVINKRNSRKYRDLVPEVIGALNDGTFAEKYMNAYAGGDVNVIAGGSGEHLRALSDDVRQIREQGETKTYVDGRGNTVVEYKNVKRIIKAA